MNTKCKDTIICKSCGGSGKPTTTRKGILFVEMLLWGIAFYGLTLHGTLFLIFGLIGIIYSLRRWLTKKTVCPHCQSRDYIPIDSPVAVKMIYEQAKAKQANQLDPLEAWEQTQL